MLDISDESGPLKGDPADFVARDTASGSSSPSLPAPTPRTEVFTLVQSRQIPEYQLDAALYRHDRLGTEVISLRSADPNVTISISLKTPVNDPSGLPHAVEHAIWYGSDKFRGPNTYGKLGEACLLTALDAETSFDQTTYAFASPIEDELFKAFDVVFDALLHPRLTNAAVASDIWRYEFDDRGKLHIAGTLYNEMRYSVGDVLEVAKRFAFQKLLPKSRHSFDFGGIPQRIVDIDALALKQFHQRYYHPGNMRITVHGDHDPDKVMAKLATIFDAIPSRDFSIEDPIETRFAKPRKFHRYYSSQAGKALDPKALVLVEWLVPKDLDFGAGNIHRTRLLNDLIHTFLLGTECAPFKTALNEWCAETGGDLIREDLANERLAERRFVIGIRGLERTQVGHAEGVILDSLKAQTGEIDATHIRAACSLLRHQLLSGATSSAPRGQWLHKRALASWMRGGEPLEALGFEADLSQIETEIASGTPVIQATIGQSLVRNNHRVTAVMHPKTENPDTIIFDGRAERAWLDGLGVSHRQEEISRIGHRNAALRRLLTASKPGLADPSWKELRDEALLKQPNRFRTLKVQVGDARTLLHGLDTDGLFPSTFAFNLHSLPQELLPYAPLVAQALVNLGPNDTTPEKFLAEREQIIPSLGTVVVSFPNRESGQNEAFLAIDSESPISYRREQIEFLKRAIVGTELDNQDEVLAIIDGNISEFGNPFTGQDDEADAFDLLYSRSFGHLSLAGRVCDLSEGLEQFLFLKQLRRTAEQSWPTVLRRMQATRDLLFRQGN
ncbi:MAG: insulinase family protein, partial [Bdellovibrionales bacterium]|nr:insulinase family protein [Bdellovibrionales bacterium]